MNALMLALRYLPLVLQAVAAVEGVFGSGQGATKKQLVMDSIAAAAKAAGQAPHKDVAVVGQLIDHVVGSLNASGVFAKHPTP